ncbi:MAG: flagellar M-ring protein FliF [Treponema sp.]|nr:flagellar M-ring protein FliF [Treponema sp.]
MNEWLKKFLANLKERWSKWSIVQKVILIGIVVAVIAAIVLTSRVSSAPTTVPLFTTAITDQNTRDDILLRMDQEGVKAYVNADGVISVADEATARRMRNILIEEDKVPSTVDAFSLFDVTSWTITDFERNVNLQRSITRMVTQQLEALSGISRANVVIGQPKDELFADNQKPVTASVILYFSDPTMAQNRKKIQTVQKILMRAVVGLRPENITIADSEGNELNDFEGMAESDRLSLIERTEKFIQKTQTQYRAKILKSMQNYFSEDRVRDLDIKIDMDTSKVSSEKTIYTPVMITEQDPSKPYDTTEKRDYLPRSSQTITKEWTGTGYNPEGPAGVEGQNPPVMSDMSNVIGKSVETSTTQNNEMNTEHRVEERMPSIDRVTVSVNIDGKYRIPRDPKTHEYIIDENGGITREYIPPTQDELEQVANYIQGAVGYDQGRNYRVVVTSLQIDRTEQFRNEDDAYFARQRRNRTIMWVLIGVTVVLIAFIIFRFISRELERRRRLREEELLRRQQAEREKALWDARQEGMEVTMSVEERKRAELLESAVAMAKEHPEDVAMLIRTWMMEE